MINTYAIREYNLRIMFQAVKSLVLLRVSWMNPWWFGSFELLRPNLGGLLAHALKSIVMALDSVVSWGRAIRYSCISLLIFHLECSYKNCKYSVLQRRQKCCRICLTFCHLSKRFSETSLWSLEGKLFSAVPTRKCPRVRWVMSFGSELKVVMGHELRTSRSSEPCRRCV